MGQMGTQAENKASEQKQQTEDTLYWEEGLTNIWHSLKLPTYVGNQKAVT